MGCQTAIAAAITQADADYVLALKGNQDTLYEDVALMFTQEQATAFREVRHQSTSTVEKDHGRLETRHYWLIDDPHYLEQLRHYFKKKGYRYVALFIARRRMGRAGRCVTNRYGNTGSAIVSRPESPVRCTSCGTPMPRSWSVTAGVSAPSASSWATRTYRRHYATPRRTM